jgi:hypothetical protein
MQQTNFAPAFQIKFTAAPKQFSANFGFLFFSFANSIQFNLIILPIAAGKKIGLHYLVTMFLLSVTFTPLCTSPVCQNVRRHVPYSASIDGTKPARSPSYLDSQMAGTGNPEGHPLMFRRFVEAPTPEQSKHHAADEAPGPPTPVRIMTLYLWGRVS